MCALGRRSSQDVVLVPDLAGWLRERMPHLPSGAAFQLPPDWVAEVLSPSTARVDNIRKLSLYLQAGVGHVWLIDPVARTVEVYRSMDGVPAQIQAYAPGVDEGAPPRLAPFTEVDLELERWWVATPG